MNGINPFTVRSRHIYIRCFFIKDRVDIGDISIRHCRSHLILVNYFTKLLQGSLFRKFWDIIMCRVCPYTLLDNIASYSSKKRVGKHIPLKYIPSKTGGPLKDKEMREDEKVKEVHTYADIVYKRRSKNRLSNREEGIKFNKFWENSLI